MYTCIYIYIYIYIYIERERERERERDFFRPPSGPGSWRPSGTGSTRWL